MWRVIVAVKINVVVANEHGDQAESVSWRLSPLPGTLQTHPGVYCRAALKPTGTIWASASPPVANIVHLSITFPAPPRNESIQLYFVSADSRKVFSCL